MTPAPTTAATRAPAERLPAALDVSLHDTLAFGRRLWVRGQVLPPPGPRPARPEHEKTCPRVR